MATNKQKRKIVEVTTELISIAIKSDSAHCMIADAVRVALPEARSITVDLQTIRYSDPEKGKRYVMLTPSKCQEKLILFDVGADMEPWSFRMPDPVQIVSMRTKGVMDNPPANRVVNVGPKVWKQNTNGIGNRQGIVTGGDAPPLNILAHSPRGNRRVYGARVSQKFARSVAAGTASGANP